MGKHGLTEIEKNKDQRKKMQIKNTEGNSTHATHVLKDKLNAAKKIQTHVKKKSGNKRRLKSIKLKDTQYFS